MATNNHWLPTSDPNIQPRVSRISSPFTPRRAVDSSGRLGLFYDACYEKMLQPSTLNFTRKTIKSQRRPDCCIQPHKSEESSNLLKWYNVYHELRLSVALQMVEKAGVGGLANYSGPIDKYTRFICYDYYGYTECLSDDEFESLTRNKIPISNTLATHVIVLVNWGVCAVAILQLPCDEDINKLDEALKNLCSSLSSDHATTSFSQEHRRRLEKVVQTEVFSSIPDLAKINSIIDFHDVIPRIKGNPTHFKPYNYNLCPIQYFYSANNGIEGIYKEIQREDACRIEDYLLQLLSWFTRSKTAMNQPHSNLQRFLKNQFSEMSTKLLNLEQMYTREIQRLRNAVVHMRSGKSDRNMIYEVLNGDKKKELIKSIGDFEYDLEIIQEKDHLISDLLEKQFEYRDASEYGIQNGDDEHVMQRKLLDEDKFDHVICFNNNLCSNKSEWDKLVAKLIKKRAENQLKFVFADFSYCSRDLDRFIILPAIKSESYPRTPDPTPVRSPSARPKGDGAINILLLGESGVGKSTFINALANYLTFNTLGDAERNPVVLISVYFLMTVGDDFQERPIKFSKQDDLHNEDYEHTGQSVTQHCKSYVFTLQDGDGTDRKIRIIDTPGIGDVRGVAQDDINMQHILSYITNLTHLNAVCILMKPNNARLNIFFRSCFTQLFDLLGENARDKIIFCFTNSRSTFYTPGDTGPLLKKLLESLPIKGILFTKQNTFCFDSESFRYLVAKRNEIKFSDLEEKDYNDSWVKSSTESKNFLEYIRTKTISPIFPGEFESMKDAQLKIAVLSRPILETIRNILRNIILLKTGSQKKSIELRPKVIEGPLGICLKCRRPPTEIEGFWITRESLHAFHNNCRTCDCAPSDHYSIDYQLEYKSRDRPVNHSEEEMIQMKDDLYQAITEFGYFLVGETGIPQNDLFLTGIMRMLEEESEICKDKTSCELNLNLLSYLEEIKEDYEKKCKKLLAKNERIELSKIYARIADVSKYETIRSQMAAAKEWHKLMIKIYELEVSV